jgi:hypothetical protein
MFGTGILARFPRIARFANRFVKHLYALRWGSHREAIGGEWDIMGPAQLNFMKSSGLKPQHKLLDVDCGSLRGGVRFISYLDESNYYGIEKEASLVKAGLEIEVPRYRLQDKKPNVFVIDDFDISSQEVHFDFMFAHSLFSHLTPEMIELCLDNLLPWLTEEGAFYVDYKQADEMVLEGPHKWRCNEISKARYPQGFFDDLAAHKGYDMTYIGDWPNHTKDKMLKFGRLARS